MIRLDTSPEGARNAPSLPPRSCHECGETFSPTRIDNDFCGARCRQAFNNRRAQRGALIYDLLMAQRYERDEAKARSVWTTLTRLAQQYREDDLRDRAGRKSWVSIRKALARIPFDLRRKPAGRMSVEDHPPA